jgi:hypothetical protein
MLLGSVQPIRKRRRHRPAGQRSTTQPQGLRGSHKSTCAPNIGPTWGKVHVHLAPNHSLPFLDLAAAALSLDINSGSHRLALNMNFDDVEERDGL